MTAEGNIGVTYLIECAERATNETERTLIYQALAEAGGTAAQDYLVGVARHTTTGSKKSTLLKLIGRASRHG